MIQQAFLKTPSLKKIP